MNTPHKKTLELELEQLHIQIALLKEKNYAQKDSIHAAALELGSLYRQKEELTTEKKFYQILCFMLLCVMLYGGIRMMML